MNLRTYLAFGSAALIAMAGCGDDDHHGDDDGHHHEDGGHHHEDGGHHHEDGGGCLHTGAAVECDEDIETVGASVSEHDTTIEVTGVEPEGLTGGAGGDYMLMLTITDSAGDPVDGVTIAAVYTMAHGMHEACGAPELTQEDDGSYHLQGLTYPHGGTWLHAFQVGDEEVTLPLCVANEGD